jgi:hypothetical protein
MPDNFTPLDSSRPSVATTALALAATKLAVCGIALAPNTPKLQKMEHDMETWEFLQRESGAWYWRHTSSSGAVRTSAVSFECRSDCVGNAIYHGYLPHTPHLTRPQMAMSL